jgi:hypothetical protein
LGYSVKTYEAAANPEKEKQAGEEKKPEVTTGD